jgi:hypothetical protein
LKLCFNVFDASLDIVKRVQPSPEDCHILFVERLSCLIGELPGPFCLPELVLDCLPVDRSQVILASSIFVEQVNKCFPVVSSSICGGASFNSRTS